MERKKFKVIQGKKLSTRNQPYRFVRAYATNTRLMGVIGLRIQWEMEDEVPFYQFFHLDAEDYGIDDYISIEDGNIKQVENTTMQMMGGLGGKLVSLSEKEAVYLVQQFAHRNQQMQNPLPISKWEYTFLLERVCELSQYQQEKLWNKLCEKVVLPIQLVNYFIMRAVGNDPKALRYLWVGDNLQYKPVKQASTLLKNVTEVFHEGESISYISESIIDSGKNYHMMVSEIKATETLQGWKAYHAEIKSNMNISHTEAALILNKQEYLSIYSVKDIEKVLELFNSEKKHAMRHVYEGGYLYIEFNATNEHVKQSTYFLNDDIYGVYYITSGNQLVVGAYTPERLEKMEKYFRSNLFRPFLRMEEQIALHHSILFEFVHSAYTNFYDFLNKK